MINLKEASSLILVKMIDLCCYAPPLIWEVVVYLLNSANQCNNHVSCLFIRSTLILDVGCTYEARVGLRSPRWSSGRTAPSCCWMDRRRGRRGRWPPRRYRRYTRNTYHTERGLHMCPRTRDIWSWTGLDHGTDGDYGFGQTIIRGLLTWHCRGEDDN